MDALMVGLRVVLAGVFAVAAAGKVFDQAGTRTAMAEFEVPERFQRPAAAALPAGEIVVAVALLLAPSARWGAVGAIVLLSVFMVGIGAALRRGQAPDCHCFGQLHSEPAGKGTLVRNAVLVALAAVVAVAGPGPAIDAWTRSASAGELLVSAAVVVGLGLAGWAEARWSRARSVEIVDGWAQDPAGLSPGKRAPRFELLDLEGSTVPLDALTATGRPVALFFTHPECGPCGALLPKVAYWQEALEERITIAVVSQGGAEKNAPLGQELQLRHVLLEQGREVYEQYRIRGTPSIVVVSPDGKIASDTGTGEFEIEEVLRRGVRLAGNGVAPRATHAERV